MDINFKEKVVVITGAEGGIGSAMVRKFAENGAKVAICDLNCKGELEKELKEKGNTVKSFSFNVSNKDETTEAMKQIVEEFGKIDILVNNAGVSSSVPFSDYTIEEYDRVMDLNVKAMFVCSKVALDYLKETRGSIINTSSMVSIYGQPSGVMYPASKFAVNGFTKSLSRELAPLGIRVNAVAPGITETDMVKNLPKEMIEPLIKTIPLGRIGTPKDVANACLYLASNMASYVTGEILQVDGAARS